MLRCKASDETIKVSFVTNSYILRLEMSRYLHFKCLDILSDILMLVMSQCGIFQG